MSNMCSSIHGLVNKGKIFDFPFCEEEIPSNGLYILFERGESAHGARRIVRVGTHTGDDQLKSRLRQHFLKENKDRSIFRKNIGRAILNKRFDAFLNVWELDLTSKLSKDKYAGLIDFKKQKSIEQEVSKYIQKNFSFVVFRIDKKKERLEFESKIISTISLCCECGPSQQWLGLFSPKEKIRESGLWLVNELYKQPLSDSDFKRLEESMVL